MPFIILDDLVCFPGAVVPLYISAKTAIKAIDEAMAGGRNIFVAYQNKGQSGRKLNDMQAVGTICRIVQIMKLPNNSSRVLLEGLERASLEIIQEDSHISVKELELDNAVTPKIAQLMRVCIEHFQQYAALTPKITRDNLSPIESADAPHRLIDLIAAQLSIPMDRRLLLLAECDTETRLNELAVIIQSEYSLLNLKSDISERVKKRLEHNQKEYFLNEQIKELNKELGKDDDDSNGAKDLENRLTALPLPAEYVIKTQTELKRLNRLQAMTPEASIVRTWLELVASLPWQATVTKAISLQKAKEILDQDHYDLEIPKDRILDYLAVRRLKTDIKAPILCFVGPPGTGKTSLGKSLANALDRPFIRVSLGGVRDEAEIRGHRRTYVGALPGKIIQNIRKSNRPDPVFLLDEIDKLASDQRGDPSSALLEVLDPEQNSSFTDHYLELPWDLSQVLFIATANNLANIPYALRDRMEIIDIPGYSRHDKLKIAEGFILPRQLAEHGFVPGSVRFSPPALAMIVDEYTLEAGVRNLERKIATVLRKIARTQFGEEALETDGLQDRIGALNLMVEPELVREFLKKPKKPQSLISTEDTIGLANGMAWSELGGTVMSVEVSIVDGKGEISLTGSLGDVMKESARIALSFLRTLKTELAVKPETIACSDIHIHVPEGATPKDGPSAGITLCATLASAFSRRPLRGGFAMTGEITLTGRVLAVGGVREKVLAAHRHGLRQIILPEKNRIDAEELPAEIRQELSFHFVNRMEEVLEILLLPSPL